MIRTFGMILALAVAGCGGKTSAPATTMTPPPAPMAATGSAAEPSEGLPPEMTRFHDLLRPLWHAEKGPKRMADTCAAVPQLQTEADAIAKATPPTAANADTWTNGTRALVAAVGDLAAACKTNDNAKFEAAFSRVHDAFHALMKAARMKHDEHEAGGGHAH